VLIALLAFEGVNLTRSSDQAEHDSFHKKVLENFDDEYSKFYQCLGLKANKHVVRFRKQNEDPPHNAARAAIERLRKCSEWYRSSFDSSARRRHFNDVQVSLPEGQELLKVYTTIMHALVKALTLCMEGTQTNSVTSRNDHRCVDIDPAKHESAPSMASSQLALSSSGDDASNLSNHEWDFVQSTTKLSSLTVLKSVPTSTYLETRKKAIEKMMADTDCKATRSPLTTAAATNVMQGAQEPVSAPSTTYTRPPDAPPVPVLNPYSWNGDQKRATAGATAWAKVPSTAPDKSTEVIASIKQDAGLLIEGKLTEHISLLNQELANEKTSREVEKRGHIAYITKLNRELTKAKKNFAILLENDRRQNKELDAADASKAELQNSLKDVAKAKHEAERERNMCRHKLELTFQENARLWKDVEKAREKGREDIRTQVSMALRNVLSPSLQW